MYFPLVIKNSKKKKKKQKKNSIYMYINLVIIFVPIRFWRILLTLYGMQLLT